MPRCFLLCVCVLSVMYAADTAPQNNGTPAATTVVISPLSIEEAAKWTFFSQILPVREKEGLLLDTMDAKNQLILVHSITYFKGYNGQMYAVVNYLRPRPVPQP